jgi:hypothetical protein
MIHIAPCSCELHVEIRRLEALVQRARELLPDWPSEEQG